MICLISFTWELIQLYNLTDVDGFYGIALYPKYSFGKLTTGVKSRILFRNR